MYLSSFGVVYSHAIIAYNYSLLSYYHSDTSFACREKINKKDRNKITDNNTGASVAGLVRTKAKVWV